MLSLKRTLPLQIIALLGTSATLYTARQLGGCEPIIRAHPLMVVRGIAAACLTLAAFAAYHGILLRLLPAMHAAALRAQAQVLRQRTSFARAGGAIIAGCAEEIVLRGLIFGCSAPRSVLLAYCVNAAAIAILYYRGRGQLSWTLGRILEGTFYAYLYEQHRSLTLVAVAHFGVELAGVAILIHPRLIPMLTGSPLTRRKIHAAFRSGS